MCSTSLRFPPETYFLRHAALAAALLLGLACGGDSTGPSATEIRIEPSSARLLLGSTLELMPLLQGSNTSGGGSSTVVWSTSNLAIVTVDQQGLARAVGAGEARIEATQDGAVAAIEIQVPEPVGSVGSSGGVLEAFDGGVRLEFPAGAMAEETAISVEEASPDSLPETGAGAQLVPGTAHEFGPRGLAFQEGVTVSIVYDPTRLPSGVAEEDLRLHRATGTGWDVSSSGSVDPAADVVRGVVREFSVYAVLSSPSGAPSVEIAYPKGGATFSQGEVILFQGSATDPTDGTLSGSSLEWSSSVDGVLGTGTSFTESASELTPGSHVITLEATDNDGIQGTARVTITIGSPSEGPSVSITDPADGQVFEEGQAIEFTGTASDAVDGDLTSAIVWTSNLDGQIGTGASISRILSPGVTHQVTARVTDSDGNEATATIDVTVDAAPSVDITDPSGSVTIQEGDAITFQGSATDPEDGDLSASLTWSSDLDGDLGTGAVVETGSLSTGSHIITATVSDSRGQTVSDQVAVNVGPNRAPAVEITAPSEGDLFQAGEAIAFSGSATDDEDGDVSSSLVWSSSIDGQIGIGASFTTTLSPDEHIITATATDSDDTAGSTSVTITVNAQPTVTITAPADGSTVEEGESIPFTGSATDPEDGDISASLVWTSNLDGEIGTGGSFEAALSVGDHTITATVTDSNGATATDEITVAVNGAPSVSISEPTDGSTFDEGESITFVGSATDPEQGDISASLVWTSDLDGQIGMGASVTETLTPGDHTITATVTDARGLTATDQITITMNALPQVTILKPNDGEVFEDGDDEIAFEGSATDPEDGELKENSAFVWTSSIDGPFGQGRKERAELSEGTHEIVLTATDSDGGEGTASITIVVGSDD